MSRIGVSLEITSESATLAELQRLLGVEPHPGSQDRGAGRRSTLRLSSPREAGLEPRDRLGWIAERLPPGRLQAVREQLELDVSVSVARFISHAASSFQLDLESLDVVRAYGATLEFVAYPTD